MANATAEAFIEALGCLEREREVGPLVALFADDSSAGNVVSPSDYRGPEGARAFWEHYRATFNEVRSSFRSVIGADGRAALEWSSEGTTRAGAPLRYEGVSLLTFEGGKIKRFYAYFDPRALGHQLQAAT